MKKSDFIERKTSLPALGWENSFRIVKSGVHREGDAEIDFAAAAFILILTDFAIEPERDSEIVRGGLLHLCQGMDVVTEGVLTLLVTPGDDLSLCRVISMEGQGIGFFVIDKGMSFGVRLDGGEGRVRALQGAETHILCCFLVRGGVTVMGSPERADGQIGGAADGKVRDGDADHAGVFWDVVVCDAVVTVVGESNEILAEVRSGVVERVIAGKRFVGRGHFDGPAGVVEGYASERVDGGGEACVFGVDGDGGEVGADIGSGAEPGECRGADHAYDRGRKS